MNVGRTDWGSGKMMHSVLDMLLFGFSWDIQVEKFRRPMSGSGNQEGLEADG